MLQYTFYKTDLKVEEGKYPNNTFFGKNDFIMSYKFLFHFRPR